MPSARDANTDGGASARKFHRQNKHSHKACEIQRLTDLQRLLGFSFSPDWSKVVSEHFFKRHEENKIHFQDAKLEVFKQLSLKT